MLGYMKTASDIECEELAEKTVIEKSPDLLREELQQTLAEYRAQRTIEARFVKAIDKFEPLVQLYNERGKKTIHRNGTTAKQSLEMKLPYLADFPYVKHFCLTLQAEMEEEGYFV